MTRTCAVESCGHRQGSKVKDGCTFSKFPKNVDRCRRWLQALGDRDLLGLSLETLSKDRFVCSCHFNEDDYSIRDKTKKIKPSALPVKFSSNVTASSDYEILEFPPSTNQIIQSMRIEIPTSELCNLTQPKKHGVLNPIYLKSPESKQLQELSVTEDRSLLPITDFVELEDETMTVSSQGFINDDLLSSSSSQIPSFSSSPLSPSTTPLHSQIVVKSPSRSSSMFSGHSSQIENNLKEKSVACLKRPHSSNEISMPERKTAMDMAWNKENMDSNTSSSSQRSQYHSVAELRMTNRKIANHIGMDNVVLTPNKKKLCVALRQKDRQIDKLKEQVAELQEELCKWRKPHDFTSELTQQIEKPELRDLVISYFRNKDTKNPHGKRYTLNDKITGVSLLKRGAKAYQFMESIVSVPKPRTLRRTLSRVPLDPGSNKTLLNCIKSQSTVVNENDRYVILSLDEMALKIRLILPAGSNKVKGFVDYGNGDRHPDTADHK